MAQLTHPEWNHETGGLEVARAFSEQIKGKTVLITGVSPESIGSSTALSIASQSPSLLILASRTPSKLSTVQSTLHSAHPTTPTALIPLDLSSQDSIRSAAAAIAKLTPAIHLIINNAAVMTLARSLTPEGIELQFGANHIGHFLLTNLLLPQLLAAAKTGQRGATRVVNVTSLGHRLSPVRFADYNFEGGHIPSEERPASLPPSFAKATVGAYNGYIAYGQAKSANVLFSVHLNRLLKGMGVASYAVHPGSIWTGLARNLDEEGEAAIRKTSAVWKDLDQGCATTLVAALDPALNDPMGVLLHDCQMCDAAPHATDPGAAERLWALSEKLVKTDFKL